MRRVLTGEGDLPGVSNVPRKTPPKPARPAKTATDAAPASTGVDFAELARVGHVTRARVTQIMNLLNLSPDIQEALLFLPLVEEGTIRSRSG